MSQTTDLPEELPLFPLQGAILLPGEILPLNVFEPRYLNMLDDVRRGSRYLGIIQSRSGGDPERPELAGTGTAGRLKQMQETDDGRYLISLVGVSRFQLAAELDRQTPYRMAKVDYTPYAVDRQPRAALEGDRTQFLQQLEAWFEAEQLTADWCSLQAAPLAKLVDQLSMSAPFPSADRQALLEARDPAERLQLMQALLEVGTGGRPGGSVH
ncbi:LON peptidase substrate-binding domain-containing protein [Maricaulis sp.]|uniref:LON peptidase substrate-binding domain-containing protein n=1 Tax=Maricaulis sp. TaxID=1486257 RepID=UPI002B265E7C|nr:LON peptidase substrate-binding domain-containing protein [Maricaulis sp.]